MNNPALFTALADPTRLRILELLDAAPRSVGEVATELSLRQPQATKHLQALERAGVVTMHPLGQRRIYSLRREPLVRARDWLDGFTRPRPFESVLAGYESALATETALAADDPHWAVGRTLRFVRDLAAPIAAVWSAWTTPTEVAKWWAPEHFTVAECEVEPVADGYLRIVLAEGDGTRYDADGRFIVAEAPERLEFELAPLMPDGTPLFSAVYTVSLVELARGTRLTLRIRIANTRPEAAPAIAGIRPGWEQALDALSRALG